MDHWDINQRVFSRWNVQIMRFWTNVSIIESIKWSITVFWMKLNHFKKNSMKNFTSKYTWLNCDEYVTILSLLLSFYQSLGCYHKSFKITSDKLVNRFGALCFSKIWLISILRTIEFLNIKCLIWYVSYSFFVLEHDMLWK